MSSRNAEGITDLFNRYDTEKSGKINKAQLRACLSDLNGCQIDETEVGNVSGLMEIGDDGFITLASFIRVIELFFKYC